MQTLLLLLAVAGAEAPASHVALATGVTGKVTYKAPSTESAELVAFAKMRRGDVVTVPPEGAIELMYFVDGHSETFKGPLDLVVGSATEPVTRSDGDALVGEALRGLPELVQRAELDKGGHTLLRGKPKEVVPIDDDDRAEIEVAKKHYDTLREAAGQTDVLPELYLASVYLSFQQDAEAVSVLQQAHERCADCAGPNRLLDLLDPDRAVESAGGTEEATDPREPG